MCGRFNIVPDASALIDAFDVLINTLDDYQAPQLNIPPTSPVPIVSSKEGVRSLSAAHWGLIPPWATDTKSAFRMINARAETIAEKASFRVPIVKSRCIVPASGWYEWRKEGDIKQPYYFQTGEILAFAAISVWNKPLSLLSCSILTTQASASAAQVHHRMPVLLGAQNYAQWLDPAGTYTDIKGLLKPYAGNDLSIIKVTTRVNNARYKGHDCIEAI
ncbi:MAG: SOS response-associated peptidase [Pseudomonadales bacterium]|nr:SOS response-associated peptidase [Pseudomonadales bacterium]